MKTLLVLLLLAFPTFAQDVHYDKFKDQTLISSDRVTLANCSMSVKAIHKGADITYYLVFRTVQSDWLFLRSRELIFLADGERISLGSGSHDGKILTRGVSEVMIYVVPREDLEAIVKAAIVEVKLGRFTDKVGEKEKKGMKEVLGYVVK